MPLIEKRYAEALISVALPEGNVDIFQQELLAVVEIFNQQTEFKHFLLNPEIKNNIKKDTIKRLFDGKLNPQVINFLLLLLDKSRMSFLEGILKEFIELADKLKDVLYISITSALPLQDGEVNAIKEKYRKLYNSSTVKAELDVDPALIGGIKVKIGDKVMDGSIKGRLESLKKLMVNS